MKLLLHLTGSMLAAYEYRQGALHEMGSFAASDEGVAAFDAYLATVPELPTAVLADLAEEEFRLETLPHLWGRDRRALLARHAGRLYRSTPYRYATVHGRAPGERRKDEVLFSALTTPAQVDVWLTALEKRQQPVTGIYSLPLISAGLLKALAPGHEKVLLLTHNLHGGLRQTYFEKGRFRFSRLSQVPAARDPAYPAAVNAEISKTKRYLGSLRFLQPDERLAVCLVSGSTALPVLEREVVGQKSSYYHLCATSELAGRLGRKVAEMVGEETPYCDRLFLGLLSQGARRAHYGRDDQRRGYLTYQARRVSQVAAGVVLATGVLGSGFTVGDALIFRHQAELAHREADRIQAVYEQVAARLPETEVSATAIAAAVRLADHLRARRQLPTEILVKISHGLEHRTLVRLDAIDWRGVMTGAAADAGHDADQGAASAGEDGGYLPANLPGNLPGDLQSAVLRGSIHPFHGDYLRAHREVRQLAAALRDQPGVTGVQILKLPLDTNPATAVEGRFGKASTEEQAVFSLRVTLRSPAREHG